MKIDIYNTPFSRYGSYISFTDEKEPGCFMIHNVRRRFGEDEAFEVRIDGWGEQNTYCSTDASPSKVRITCKNAYMDVYIRDADTIVFDSYGVDFSVCQQGKRGYGIQVDGHTFKMISQDQRIYSLFVLQCGRGTLDGPYIHTGYYKWNDENIDAGRNMNIHCVNNRAVLAIKISNVEAMQLKQPIEPEAEQQLVQSEWKAFIKKVSLTDQSSNSIDEFALMSWFNIWSGFVKANDVYRYDTVLMSKKYMSSVWSWDHCFNALALAKVDGRMALEQFLVPFEVQSDSGALPDMMNPNSEIVWGITKPPIHGWCFRKLMDEIDFDKHTLDVVYEHLEKWTNWWMTYRDSDHDGIPEYPMGNDSGWDNSTVFDSGYYIESPDLSAFLVIQMQTLSQIADKLGRSEDCGEWKGKAEILKAKMYNHFWNQSQFIAKHSRTHAWQENCKSLLLHMPILLGEQLDLEKANKIADTLKKKFLTRYGLATEAPDSARYQPDGYWRGPIWAPSTYLIIDGLRRRGFTDLAREIAMKYLSLSADTAKGNFENFNAITGEGQRAPGYTWSASVFLLLYNEYVMQ